MTTRKKTPHAAAVAFFMKHAGYSQRTGQTKAQAKRRTAIALAKAEAEAARRGWTFTWNEDPLPYEMGDAETEHPDEVLNCVLQDKHGTVLESLSGIGDPSREYCRVVEAELALEALSPRF